MSTFLGFESFEIPLGDDVQDVQNTFESALTTYGWQSQKRALIPTSFPSSTMTNYLSAFNMTDGDYAGQNYISSGILGMLLPSAFAPVTMHILVGDGSQAPKNFTLEYSTDGNTWTVLQQWLNESNWYMGELRRYVVSGATPYQYWRLKVTDCNSQHLYIGEWFLEDSIGNRTTNTHFIDVIPPAYEPIGDSNSYEAVRLTFGGNTLSIKSVQYTKTFVPQVVAIWEKVAGAVVPGVNINGATVNGTVGSLTSTAKENLRSLYNAIKASSDSNYTDWTWEYQTPSPQNADDGYDYIYGTKKTYSPFVIITPNSSVNACAVAGQSAAFTQGPVGFDTTNTTLTTDLIDGFIYYLQICSRGIALATKTNAVFSGPIHACYANNTKALASVPQSGMALKCTPIELLVGWDDVSANSGSGARPSHVWGISNYTAQGINSIIGGLYDTTWGSPFGHGRIRGKILDYFIHSGYYSNYTITLFGSSLFNGASNVGNDSQIHRVNCIGETIGSANNSLVPVSPALDIQDWYKFVGTSTDEALLLVADTQINVALPSNLDTSATVITVSSTSGFQSSGYIVIENEIIQYTNITGTSFLNCVRGKNGTAIIPHFSGDLVCQGLWFTKINGGALFCGYQKPV